MNKKKFNVVVECGAYLGHKTIRFCNELLSPKGIIYAYEMMPDNYEILKMNIKANNLQKRIIPIQCGVLDEKKVIEVNGYGRQRNTITDLEKLKNPLGLKVKVFPFSHLINEIKGYDAIDLCFVTINGAEVKALSTIKKCKKVIKQFFIAAPYMTDKKRNLDLCLDILKENKYKIFPVKGKKIEASIES